MYRGGRQRQSLGTLLLNNSSSHQNKPATPVSTSATLNFPIICHSDSKAYHHQQQQHSTATSIRSGGTQSNIQQRRAQQTHFQSNPGTTSTTATPQHFQSTSPTAISTNSTAVTASLPQQSGSRGPSATTTKSANNTLSKTGGATRNRNRSGGEDRSSALGYNSSSSGLYHHGPSSVLACDMCESGYDTERTLTVCRCGRSWRPAATNNNIINYNTTKLRKFLWIIIACFSERLAGCGELVEL